MPARSSTRARTSRSATGSCSPGGSGSARSPARRATRSRRRGASMPAAARRCAAMAIRIIGPRDPNNDPDRRAQPGRILDRGAGQGVRQFRHRAVPRRRQYLHLGRCRTSTRSALRRRARRALLFQLRADPHRCRHADQPRSRAIRASRSMSRWDRRFERRRDAAVAEAPIATVAPHGRGGGRCSSGARVPALLAALVAARHRASATAASSTGIAALRTASGLRFRVGRIDGSIYGRAMLLDVRGQRSRAGCSSPRRASSSTGRRCAWLDNRLDITRLHIAAGDAVAAARDPAERQARGRSCPASTSISALCAVDRLTIGAGGHRRRAHRAAAAARPMSARGRALVDLDCGRRRAATAPPSPRRRARSRPVRRRLSRARGTADGRAREADRHRASRSRSTSPARAAGRRGAARAVARCRATRASSTSR